MTFVSAILCNVFFSLLRKSRQGILRLPQDCLQQGSRIRPTEWGGRTISYVSNGSVLHLDKESEKVNNKKNPD